MDVFGGYVTTAQVEEQQKELTSMVETRLQQHTTAMSDMVSKMAQGIEEIKNHVQNLVKHEKRTPKQQAAKVVDGVTITLGDSLRKDIQVGLDRGVTNSTSAYSHWLAKERDQDQRYALALERFMNNTEHQLDAMWAQCDARERSVRQEMEDARSGHTVEIAQMAAERQDAIRALNELWSGNAAE